MKQCQLKSCNYWITNNTDFSSNGQDLFFLTLQYMKNKTEGFFMWLFPQVYWTTVSEAKWSIWPADIFWKTVIFKRITSLNTHKHYHNLSPIPFLHKIILKRYFFISYWKYVFKNHRQKRILSIAAIFFIFFLLWKSCCRWVWQLKPN